MNNIVGHSDWISSKTNNKNVFLAVFVKNFVQQFLKFCQNGNHFSVLL